MNINHQITISSAKNKLNPVQNYEKQGMKAGQASTMISLGRTLTALEKFDEAKRTLLEAFQLVKAIGHPSWQMESASCLMELALFKRDSEAL